MILKRLSDDEIRQQFTHYARFAGVVPCYFNASDGHDLVSANWTPEPLLTFFVWFYGLFITAVTFIDDDYEPAWPIQLRGEIQ